MADFDFPTELPPGKTGYEQNFARFYKKTVKDEKASKAAGYAIVKSEDWVQIRIPGDKTVVIDRPVRLQGPVSSEGDELYTLEESDAYRYPRQWAAYQQNKDQKEASGTLLRLLPGLPEEQAEAYALMGVHTMEQLVGMPDGNLANMGPGIRQVRDNAKRFLEALEGSRPAMAAQAEINKANERIAALEAMIKNMVPAQRAVPTGDWAEAFAPAPEPKKKVGRPKKTEVVES